MNVNRVAAWSAAMVLLFGLLLSASHAAELDTNEAWHVDADYEKHRPTVVAVLPMDNFSLEPDVEQVLYKETYERLTMRGYRKIDAGHVKQVMTNLGVVTPGQLSGISLQRLGKELQADAVLRGQIEQSASIHQGVYDAVVVSCTLSLIDVHTGKTLWHAEQWRVAHRQWQIDPISIILVSLMHATASRTDRVAFLVREMLKTLPAGPIDVDTGDLFRKAVELKAVSQ